MTYIVKLLIVAGIAMSCVGCAQTRTQPKFAIMQHTVQLRIIENKNLPDLANGLPQHARATVGDGFCIIELRKYPKCLAHEVRHCFEGDWHKGRQTTQDC